MQKLEKRHHDTIAAFQQSTRLLSAQIDEQQTEELRNLRDGTSLSRKQSEMMLRHEQETLQAHKAALLAAKESFENRQPGEFVQVLEDRFHREGVTSLQSRVGHIEEARLNLLRRGVELAAAHKERMGMIEATAKTVEEGETARRTKIRAKLEQLMLDLSTIAFRNVTECQLLVQRAVASINDQLLENHKTVKLLIAQLKQHELLKHRDNLATLVGYYHEMLHIARESCILWTQQLFCSSAFRNPKSRTVMLHRIEQACRKTKSEVVHALQGLRSVVETLLRRRDTKVIETPGGTEANGWLKKYSEDIFSPVFTESPKVVSNEWGVFIDVILHNAQCSVVTLTEDTQSIEHQFSAEINRHIDGLLETIDWLYVPTAAEKELIAQASSDPNNVAPFHTIVENPTEQNVGGEFARAAITPVKEELIDESHWFVQHVAHRFSQHKEKLDEALAHTVIVIFKDATQLLESSTETSISMIRQFFVSQYESMKDFDDQLSWYERDYAVLVDHVAHAGTVESARQQCIQAMRLLDDIERLYRTYHKLRVGPMQPAIKETSAVTASVASQIFAKLNVASKAEYDAKTVAPAENDSLVQVQSVSKVGAKGKPQAAATGPAVVVAVPAFPILTLSSGEQYYILGPTKFGKEEPKENAAALEVAAGAAPPSATGGKKPPQKPSAKPAAAAATAAGAAAAASSTEITPTEKKEEAVASPTLSVFISTMVPLFDHIFTDECLFSASEVDVFNSTLRTTILEWMAKLSVNASLSMTTYCNENKEKLDEKMNELVRHHQRRAPTLQAQVYEVRVRELQDGENSRIKYTQWLETRLVGLHNTVTQSIAASKSELDADMADLAQFAATMQGVMSISALESHSRAFTEMTKRIKAESAKRRADCERSLKSQCATIHQECDTYSTEKLISFGDGGNMAEDEVVQAKATIDRIKADLSGIEERDLALIASTHDGEANAVNAEKQRYDESLSKNAAELKFFTEMQELFAHVKGRVSNQIAVSGNAHQRLEESIIALEKCISPLSHKADGSRLAQLLSVDYELNKGNNDAAVDREISVPPGWTGEDETLCRKLMRTALEAENLVRSSRANSAFAAFDTLRRQLFARAQYLGCLVHTTDFTTAVLPENYMDPKKDSVFDKDNSSKKAAPKGKGSGAPSPASKGPSATPAATVSDAPPKVLKAEIETLKWVANTKEKLLLTASTYFQDAAGPTIRTEVLGATHDDVVETISKRLTEQEQRSAQHVMDATKKFREQVQRVYVLVHNFAPELAIGLTNISLESLSLRLQQVFSVFNSYYCSIVRSKHQNSVMVKGSMVSPHNRGQLEEICEAEAQRQKSSLQLIRKFQGIVQREVQEEVTRQAARSYTSVNTFFAMMRSLTTPEHLIPGEEVISGEHKSLKKLMRQRQKEEAARLLEGPKDAAKKVEGKKAEPKKAAPGGKGGKAGKGAADAKDDDDLPLLERPLMDFAPCVVQSQSTRFFDKFKKEFPDVSIKNHYSLPSNWGDAAAERAALEQAEAADAAKKVPAKPSKAPPAKGGAAGGTAVAVEDEAAVTLPAIQAPRDRLHQQAVLLRQQAIENLIAVAADFAAKSESKFRSICELEQSWAKTWEEAIGALKADGAAK